jgi:hypothetical protein
MKYFEFSRFLRNQLEARELSVRQLFMACDEAIPLRRFYDWLEGVRVPQGWELALISQRLGVTVPWRYLRGENKFGEQKKAFPERQLTLPGLRNKKS